MSSTAASGPGTPSPGDPQRSDRDQDRARAARELAGVYPQHTLLARLKQFLSSDSSDPAILTEMAACAYRLQSNLEGIQAEILQRLQRTHPSSGLGEELAARLSLTTASADRLLNRAAALEDYVEVHFALLGADIDVRKADVFIDATKTLPTAEARAIHRALLPAAPHLTAGQLRHRLRAAALAVDADLAQVRHQEATKDRSVSVDPTDDGMAFLTFYLPATDAVAAMTTLDALAVKNGPDDERTVGARRTDAFMDLIHQAMATGRTPDGTPIPTQHRKRPHLVITVAQSTLDGEDDAPGYLAGYGPLSAEVVRGLARAQDDEAGSDSMARGAAPHPVAPATPTNIVGTDPCTGTLLPPAALLATDAYQPGAALREHIMVRDVTCRFPTCRQPARRCQIDHIIPFDADRPAWAQTHPGNLHLLCQRHHQLKTAGIWSVSRDHLSGDTHWISPLGYRYTRPAEVVDPTHYLPVLHQALAAIRAEYADEPDLLRSPAPVQPGLVSDAELAELLCWNPEHMPNGACTCATQATTLDGIRQRVSAGAPRAGPSSSALRIHDIADPPPY